MKTVKNILFLATVIVTLGFFCMPAQAGLTGAPVNAGITNALIAATSTNSILGSPQVKFDQQDFATLYFSYNTANTNAGNTIKLTYSPFDANGVVYTNTTFVWSFPHYNAPIGTTATNLVLVSTNLTRDVVGANQGWQLMSIGNDSLFPVLNPTNAVAKKQLQAPN